MNTLAKTFVTLGGFLGFLGVALGAFGAHALKDWAKDLPDGAKRLAWWDTGTDYLVWHALLLLGIGFLATQVRVGEKHTLLTAAGICVPVGVALFSGSLFAMTLTGITKLGMVTPLGGLAFLGAWACTALAARKIFA